MTDAPAPAPARGLRRLLPRRRARAPRLRGEARLLRRLRTPEGVVLDVRRASSGQRLTAVGLDFALLLAALGAAALVFALLVKGPLRPAGPLVAVAGLVSFFLIRNFYFAVFEAGPRAATPGKRALGLRVAARDGGRLTAEAVFLRNVTREVEVLLPLTLLALGAGRRSPAVVLFGLGWSLALGAFPLFNRDRLRVGDLLAGAWVVQEPDARLLDDVAAAAEALGGRFAFTAAELDRYGETELHALEAVLRAGEPALLADVARRVRRRIDRTAAPGETDADFLRAFYAAQRGALETRLLLGRRRTDKHAAD